MIQRRSFITGLISLVAAPAIVRAGSLMPINQMLQLPMMSVTCDVKSPYALYADGIHPTVEGAQIIACSARMASLGAPTSIIDLGKGWSRFTWNVRE